MKEKKRGKNSITLHMQFNIMLIAIYVILINQKRRILGTK